MYAKTGYETSASNLTQVTLQDDNVFGDDDGVSQLGTVTGDATSGYPVSRAFGVDTTTIPTAGHLPGNGSSGGRAGARRADLRRTAPVRTASRRSSASIRSGIPVNENLHAPEVSRRQVITLDQPVDGCARPRPVDVALGQ